MAAAAAIAGTVATGGIGGAVVAGAVGGVAGYGVGKGNEELVKKRVRETKFHHIDQEKKSNYHSLDEDQGNRLPVANVAFQKIIEIRRPKFSQYLQDNHFQYEVLRVLRENGVPFDGQGKKALEQLTASLGEAFETLNQKSDLACYLDEPFFNEQLNV